jgi:dihydrodipicolinate reductase
VLVCQLHYRGKCFAVSCVIAASVSLSAALSRQVFHCVHCIITVNVSLCQLHYRGKCFTVSAALSRQMFHCVSCIIAANVSLSAALSQQVFHCVSCIITANVSLCQLHYRGKCFTVSAALLQYFTALLALWAELFSCATLTNAMNVSSHQLQ